MIFYPLRGFLGLLKLQTKSTITLLLYVIYFTFIENIHFHNDGTFSEWFITTPREFCHCGSVGSLLSTSTYIRLRFFPCLVCIVGKKQKCFILHILTFLNTIKSIDINDSTMNWIIIKSSRTAPKSKESELDKKWRHVVQSCFHWVSHSHVSLHVSLFC